MTDVRRWHASPRRGTPSSRQPDTGEIRVPLTLFKVDEPQGDVDLVLSRVEGEQLFATLSRLLNNDVPPAPPERGGVLASVPASEVLSKRVAEVNNRSGWGR